MRLPFGDLVGLLVPADRPGGRPWVLAVDGRSGGGKSTPAARRERAVPDSAVVHADDVGWHHSFVDWQDLLAERVPAPLRRGEAVFAGPRAITSAGNTAPGVACRAPL